MGCPDAMVTAPTLPCWRELPEALSLTRASERHSCLQTAAYKCGELRAPDYQLLAWLPRLLGPAVYGAVEECAGGSRCGRSRQPVWTCTVMYSQLKLLPPSTTARFSKLHTQAGKTLGGEQRTCSGCSASARRSSDGARSRSARLNGSGLVGCRIRHQEYPWSL